MLISDLCDYSDAFIAVKGLISGTCTNNANTRNKMLTFKNNALTNINNIFIGYVEDLNIVMPQYNLVEYNDNNANYSMTSVSLWNYYRDAVYGDANKNSDDDQRVNYEKKTTSRLFEYKSKMTSSSPNDNSTLDTEVVAPLKYLSNF